MPETVEPGTLLGTRCKGSLFRASKAKGLLLILPGTGVRQTFYFRHARYWQEQGFHVLTIDYQGIGESGTAKEASDVFMHSWGTEDVESAILYLRTLDEELPLIALCHSVGGQLIGLAPSAKQELQAIILITSQIGYLGLWPWFQQPLLHLLWFFMKPATLVLGYFPSGLLGMGENLPKHVAIEWASWCRHPEHLFGFREDLKPQHESFTVPLYALSIEPDFFAPPKAVHALLIRFSKARVTHRIIHDKKLQARDQLGHFGFFRKQGKMYWQDLVSWTLGVLEASKLP